MDSRVLEYFLRVGELGSINRAAADLHLSQPALSRHIAVVEHEFGVRLFTRNHGGVQLTDAGRLLSDRARPILRQLTILKGQVGEKASGQVAIGLPGSWQGVFTTGLVQTMVTQFPAIALRVQEGVSNVLRENMLGGLLDLAIVAFDAEFTAGYQQTPLVREPMLLVGPANSKQNARGMVTIDELDGLKLAVPGRPSVLRVQLENALARKNLVLGVAVETDVFAVCLNLARSGACHTVVPASALYAADASAGLSAVPIKNMFMTWALSENEARSHSQAVAETRRMVLGLVDQQLAGGQWRGAERAAHQGRAAEKLSAR